MDWIQAAATSGVVLAGYAITYVRKSGRDEKRTETTEGTLQDHDRRLNEHDNRFEELNSKFVPRQELEETMGAIRESQKRTERWLEALMLPRVRPIVADVDEYGKK